MVALSRCWNEFTGMAIKMMIGGGKENVESVNLFSMKRKEETKKNEDDW